MPSHVSSPDALGVVRNLPAGAVGVALRPRVVSLVGDSQDARSMAIGLADVLALPQMAGGCRIERILPNEVGLE